MNRKKPIIAIVGSIREDTVDKGKEEDARKACKELGQKLAEKGFRILVYSSDPQFIESYIVSGYVTSQKAKKDSILCYHPQRQQINFPEMKENSSLFKTVVDPNQDWEISYYKSLAEVDGALILGGGYSTLITGHIILSRQLPIVSIAQFGGQAGEIWKHITSKPALIEDEDIQAMAQWNTKSSDDCINSLDKQYKRFNKNKKNDIKPGKTITAGIFMLGCIIFSILGLILSDPTPVYTIIVIVGLCISGGAGATIRLLTPSMPDSNVLSSAILGIAAGFIFSLLYLLPHISGESSFLIPTQPVVSSSKIQYLSAIIVAFIAGLGFDFSVQRLLEKIREGREDMT